MTFQQIDRECAEIMKSLDALTSRQAATKPDTKNTKDIIASLIEAVKYPYGQRKDVKS